MRDLALGLLGLSLVQYWGKTVHELSYEIDGYNARWEEKMNRLRITYALTYNIHAPKGKQKTAKQLIPLPGDAPKTFAEQRLRELENIAEVSATAKKR